MCGRRLGVRIGDVLNALFRFAGVRGRQLFALFAFVSALAMPAVVGAQEVGWIHGLVFDDESGSPLSGIEIAVETIGQLSELSGLRGFEIQGEGDDGAALQAIVDSGLTIE